MSYFSFCVKIDFLFRITQTEARLKKDNVKGECEANKTCYKIGKILRNAIKKAAGTMLDVIELFYL